MIAENISESGRRAFRAGLKPKDCPFALRSDARTWWMAGYNEAKKKEQPEREVVR